MGMSTRVIAFISPEDPTYIKHLTVLKVCNECNVSLPKETAEYFGDKHADLCLAEEKLEIDIPTYVWEAEMKSGFEVKISELPEGVYKIRFYNSW